MIDIREVFYPKQMGQTQVNLLQTVQSMCAELAVLLEEKLPSGKYKSLAMNKLEEAAMFSTKSISHDWTQADD